MTSQNSAADTRTNHSALETSSTHHSYDIVMTSLVVSLLEGWHTLQLCRDPGFGHFGSACTDFQSLPSCRSIAFTRQLHGELDLTELFSVLIGMPGIWIRA